MDAALVLLGGASPPSHSCSSAPGSLITFSDFSPKIRRLNQSSCGCSSAFFLCKTELLSSSARFCRVSSFITTCAEGILAGRSKDFYTQIVHNIYARSAPEICIFTVEYRSFFTCNPSDIQSKSRYVISSIEGIVNVPRSSRLYQIANPVRSKYSTFTCVRRQFKNIKKCPDVRLCDNACRVIAESLSNEQRISGAVRHTNTREEDGRLSIIQGSRLVCANATL